MKELLFSITKKDFDISWFSGTGAGGQYRNKHQNCCRIVHRESGASATGQSNRDRPANQKEAFNTLVNSKTFSNWIKFKISEINGDSVAIEEKVKIALHEKNLKTEILENGEWVEQSSLHTTLDGV